jgi:hypothetical protein
MRQFLSRFLSDLSELAIFMVKTPASEGADVREPIGRCQPFGISCSLSGDVTIAARLDSVTNT